MIWTIVPAIALSAIVIYGLKTWNEIMFNDNKDAKVVEIYAYQFGWQTRYAGEDNILGKADYKLITDNNPLGIITDEYIQESYEFIDEQVLSIEKMLVDNEKDGEYLLPDAQVDSLNNKRDRLKRQKTRIKASIDKGDENKEIYKHAYDDVLVKELRMVKDQPYSFRFRSKDVIHCPWIPHMRMQMNAVPGMETRFDMTPTTTTEEMRAKPEVIEHYNNISKIHHERLVSIGEKSKSDIVEPVIFNYILMCNKICGAQHSNMQMEVVVETKEEFNTWMSEQDKVSDELVKE